MPIDNLGYHLVYNTIANFDKIDLYKSEKVELAKLNQLDKQQI